VLARVEGCDMPAGEALDLSCGTPFQQAVWTAVLSIPRGETRSYGWVAEVIGKPLAAHAVGQAVARNPLPLFIPCHRVTAAGGGLGGYGPGQRALPTKRSLLRREGVHFDGPVLEQIRDTDATPV
jgi:O-6-methylguanine DNA methyltransferase